MTFVRTFLFKFLHQNFFYSFFLFFFFGIQISHQYLFHSFILNSCSRFLLSPCDKSFNMIVIKRWMLKENHFCLPFCSFLFCFFFFFSFLMKSHFVLKNYSITRRNKTAANTKRKHVFSLFSNNFNEKLDLILFLLVKVFAQHQFKAFHLSLGCVLCAVYS